MWHKRYGKDGRKYLSYVPFFIYLSLSFNHKKTKKSPFFFSPVAWPRAALETRTRNARGQGLRPFGRSRVVVGEPWRITGHVHLCVYLLLTLLSPRNRQSAIFLLYSTYTWPTEKEIMRHPFVSFFLCFPAATQSISRFPFEFHISTLLVHIKNTHKLHIFAHAFFLHHSKRSTRDISVSTKD